MKHQLTEVVLSTKGVPRRTFNEITISPSLQEPTGRWGRGVTGPAATAFPLAAEWTFEGLNKPLNKITTKDLTRLFTEQTRKDPTCIGTWNSERELYKPIELGTEGPHPVQINANVNFSKFARNTYSTAVLPPPIINLHFKFITHRRLPLTWQLEEHQNLGCRLGCGCKKETYQHFTECPALSHLRIGLAHLTEEPRYRDGDTFLLGDVAIGRIDAGAANLWLTLWHTLILAMIGRTADNVEINRDNVWKWSVRKFADFAMAAAHPAEKQIAKAIAKGIDPPTTFPTQDYLLKPLASLTSEAEVKWSPRFLTELRRLELHGYYSEAIQQLALTRMSRHLAVTFA